VSTLTREQRTARNVARHRTVVARGAASATAAMLDAALEGGRLARTDGGEGDQLRGAGTLAADTSTGRRLRLAGWVVAPGDPSALAADQVHALLMAAHLIPASATVCDAVDAYGRLALAAEHEASAAHDAAERAAEAQWWADREAFERDAAAADVDQVLTAWLGRLVHGPKFEYAAALVAWHRGEANEPADPAPLSWGPKARRRFEHLTRGAQ